MRNSAREWAARSKASSFSLFSHQSHNLASQPFCLLSFFTETIALIEKREILNIMGAMIGMTSFQSACIT